MSKIEALIDAIEEAFLQVAEPADAESLYAG